MARRMKKPNQVALAAAHAAHMIDCDFIFFNFENFDVDNNKVQGLVYQDGVWQKAVSRLPDVIDNSPPRKEHQPIFDAIKGTIPMTMRRIGNKDHVSKRILNDQVYDHLIIPFKKAQDHDVILRFLDEHHKVVLKPAGGNQGENIYYIEKMGDQYEIQGPNINDIFTNDAFIRTIIPFTLKKYIIQKYIASSTKNGIPFDIRIHVRRGKDAKWNTINIYPRIGNGNENDITSNVSQGGSISKLVPFLKNNYPEKWKALRDQLRILAREFPLYFQQDYNERIDALGLDIGVDENGEIWLFEVNSYPGSTSFELNAQIAAMNYAKFLALEQKAK